MSRIGKKPDSLPQGVTATVNGQTVTAKGPKGELKFVVNDEVLVKMEGSEMLSSRATRPRPPAQMGHVAHADRQHSAGRQGRFRKKLEITGVGYRAALQGKNPQLALGFSHDVVYETPRASRSPCRSRRKSP
jgi:large subunit ribosomal protein L6